MTNYERWLYFTKDIESPDAFIRWGFIHLVASALQRRVWYWPDEDTQLPGSYSLFPNMFIGLVGPPSTGKGRVIKQVSAAITHPHMLKTDENGKTHSLIKHSPDKVTCEKLIDCIAESTTSVNYEVVTKDGKTEKRAAGQAPCSFLIEELEVLFNTNATDMVGILNHCYDAGNLNYQTRHEGKHDIKNVCVNMLSGTTPESIKNLLTEKVIKTGFTSRVIMIYGAAPRFYKLFPGISADQRQLFNELVAHIKTLVTKVAGELKLSPEAEAYHKDIYESGRMMNERPNRDPKLDYYYGRKRVHWLKLAAILHFAEDCSGNMIISLDNMKEAYNDLNEVEVHMHEAFKSSGRNPLWESSNEIVRFIQERGNTTFKALWFKFSNDLRREEFEETLGFLLGTGQLENINGTTSNIDKGIFVYTTKLKSANPVKQLEEKVT